MSSHHIVREKQEPALLVLAMDNFDGELLGQLLEWSPTVIATTHVAEQLNSMGIKVDRILGNDVGDVLQSDVSYISVKESTPVEAALSFLIDERYGAVNIVTDDFAPDDYMQFVSKINLVILHRNKKTYAIGSGFTKWLPAGDVISVYAEPGTLSSGGLSLTDEGKFVTTAHGVVKLEFAHSFIFISETV